jgi:hypothetical protein
MSSKLRISSYSPFFKCPRVHPCECGGIHEDALFPIRPGGFNSSEDGATVDALPYFPGLKVGQIYHHSSFLTIWER